jgi:hypothetical protein
MSVIANSIIICDPTAADVPLARIDDAGATYEWIECGVRLSRWSGDSFPDVRRGREIITEHGTT